MTRVSDYIINMLLKNNMNTVFTITGGFAMHLNDSFGINKNFDIYYMHHEQACGYAAVGFTKTNAIPSIVCTTAGCAATNAISPCLVAYQDSLPIIFISGQVKSTDMITNHNIPLRHYSGADCDIISMVTPITKYAKEIKNIDMVESVISEAIYYMNSGRPGPVWISIPVDIQAMKYDMEPTVINYSDNIEYNISLNNVYQILNNSTRPIIIAGNGIKLAHCITKFNNFIKKYNIPTVVTFHGTDIMTYDNDLYVGKIGLIGDRVGNFATMNADVILCLGCRMAQGIVGYRADWFGREAKIIYIDNDIDELKKENIKYELKLNMDLNYFFDNFNTNINDNREWMNKITHWKKKWSYETPPISSSTINPYHYLDRFFIKAPNNKVILASSGSIVTNVWHMIRVKENDKFIISSQGDMGFELPASIGACIADKNKMIIPILGEGSFQLNIQELQTIKQYNLPIKILLFNNGSYGAIEMTQSNFFKNKFGVDKMSGLSFPDTEKIARAYDIMYQKVISYDEIDNMIDNMLNYNGMIITEVFCSTQQRYPRLNAIKNEDGTFTNRPFEDMDPFMDRDEFKNEMIISII